MSASTLSPLVAAVLVRQFPSADLTALADLLLSDCGSNLPLVADEALLERIRLAVLRLAGGHSAAVLDHIRAAQIDWRDVLVAAGFGNDLRAHLVWATEVARR